MGYLRNAHKKIRKQALWIDVGREFQRSKDQMQTPGDHGTTGVLQKAPEGASQGQSGR